MKRPSYGFPGDKATHCLACKKEGMINVNSNKCECGKSRPSYNFRGKVAKYCNKCKNEEMIIVTKYACKCGKSHSSYNFPNYPAKYCKDCKEEGMINVVHKPCKLCNLLRGAKKYEGYCFSCFCWKFPDSKPARRHLTKERAVNMLMVEHFPNTDFTYNKVIGGCSKRRPDWFIDCLTHCIVIECDEEQHKSYEETCEHARLLELLGDISYRPMVVLRFNPDKYRNSDGNIIKTCFPGRTTKPNAQLRERFESLNQRIVHHQSHIPSKILTQENLFFDHN